MDGKRRRETEGEREEDEEEKVENVKDGEWGEESEGGVASAVRFFWIQGMFQSV